MKISPKALRQLIKEEYYNRLLELADSTSGDDPAASGSSFKKQIQGTATSERITDKLQKSFAASGIDDMLGKITDVDPAADVLQNVIDSMVGLDPAKKSALLSKLKGSL